MKQDRLDFTQPNSIHHQPHTAVTTVTPVTTVTTVTGFNISNQRIILRLLMHARGLRQRNVNKGEPRAVHSCLSIASNKVERMQQVGQFLQVHNSHRW